MSNHTHWVSALAFSPDGKILASASADCSIKLWDTRNWREVSTLKGSQSEVYGIVFSRDGRTLFSGTRSGQVLAWDARPRSPKAQVLKRPDDAQGFGLSSPGGIPFGWHSNKTFNLWDPYTLRRLPEHPVPGFDQWTNVVARAFSPGGERLALATREGSVCLWDVERERQIACWLGWPADGLVLRFSPDGLLLVAVAAGTWEQGIKIWNAATGQEVATLKGINDWLDPNFPGRSDAVDSLVFLPPDGNALISGTDHELRLWRAPSWAEIEAAEKTAERRTP